MIGTHFHHSAIYARALLQTPRLRAPRQGKTEEVRQRYISRVGLGARELFRTGLGAREPCRELFRTGLGVGAEARIAPTEACMADSCARSAPRTWPRARPPRPAAPPPVPPAAPPPVAPRLTVVVKVRDLNFLIIVDSLQLHVLQPGVSLSLYTMWLRPALSRLCSKPTGGMESDFQERRKSRGGRG
jgi:hypothetical protein